MSFILDALKKSETDRQRQTGPALFEVKVAPPKAGFPVWAIAIVVLLVINMAIVGWMLLRRSSKADEATAQNTPPPAAVSQPAPTAPTPAPTQAPASNNSVQQPHSSPSTQQDTPAQGAMLRSGNTQGAEPEWQPPQRGTGEAAQNEPTLGGSGTNTGRPTSNGSMAGATGRAGGAGTSGDSGGNPDDDAPAQDPGAPLFKGHVKRGTESGLMLYQDLAVTNGANLPELRLDMHVYDPKPQARFALINMRKVTEGQMAGDGVKVEAITPEGVVLSHNGTRFLLPRD
jgi:general secretion pathway protein B